MYQNGWGVKKDYAKAMKYYQKSKKDKDGRLSLAVYLNIGNMYANGLWVKKDYVQAVQYLETISGGSNMISGVADYMLGTIYKKFLWLCRAWQHV
ncbi:hypothetical protein NHP21005_02720 [Helicobacter sp. NHP21005]|nr:hypothetical protein NHP21005_02720 [Helicobacter sp. NHP21005]